MLVLAACSSGGEGSGVAEGTSTTTRSETTTTVQEATTTSEATTTTTPATTSTTAPAPPPTPAFPPGRTILEHGGDAWVVVLAGSPDFDAPALATATDAAEAAGYATGPTDCDRGAATALGFEEGLVYTVSVYLADEDDAHAALAAFEARGQTGGVVALVQTYCLD